MHFCTPTMKYQKQKSGKNPISYSNKKNKVSRNKHNQGGKRSVIRKLHTLKKEIKEAQITRSIYHVHGLEELTSSKCPYYPKQSIDQGNPY